MKMIDTGKYVSALRELTDAGHEVSMVIAGGSMTPFLVGGRDSIWFRRPERALRRGDMVFYERDNGDFVMHRICRITEDGYYLIGDAQDSVEGPLRADQIFARIYQVERKGKILKEGSFWWDFFAVLWIRIIPRRRMIQCCYSRIIHRRKKP